MNEQINIGDIAYYFRNYDDIMSLRRLEVLNVYEVGLNETYAKMDDTKFKIGFGVKMDGKFIDGQLFGEY